MYFMLNLNLMILSFSTCIKFSTADRENKKVATLFYFKDKRQGSIGMCRVIVDINIV